MHAQYDSEPKSFVVIRPYPYDRKKVEAEFAKVNDRGDLMFYNRPSLVKPILVCAFAAHEWTSFGGPPSAEEQAKANEYAETVFKSLQRRPSKLY